MGVSHLEWLRQRAADYALRDEARAIMRSRKASLRLRFRAWAIFVVFSARIRLGKHSDPPKWLTLPWHGRYCGPGLDGDGLTAKPVDALDAACQDHDRDYSRPP